MKKFLISFNLLILTGTTVQAEPLKIPVMVYSVGASADLYTTNKFLTQSYLSEANPLGKMLDNRPKTMIAVSASAETLIWSTLHKTLFKNHPRFEKNAYWIGGGVRFGVAMRNENRRKNDNLKWGKRQ